MPRDRLLPSSSSRTAVLMIIAGDGLSRQHLRAGQSTRGDFRPLIIVVEKIYRPVAD